MDQVNEDADKSEARTINKFGLDTGIQESYGETSWRPVQSLIDIPQNHLDAQTTVYEKKILATVGISEYKPTDPIQQRRVSLLDQIKYATDPNDANAAYAELVGLTDGMPGLDALRSQLEDKHFVLPQMRLKVTNGEKAMFVAYEDMADLPEAWQVIGFRIQDEGAGFSPKMLEMVGASTKPKEVTKRGGLGEGLKMSIAHLLRAGADVRLASHNEDHLWIGRPVIDTDTGTVKVNILQRSETDTHEAGSMTDVDFSDSRVDPDIRNTLADALDPRKGEGLGKYILEYRGPQFVPLIDKSVNLHGEGVPGGRLYVKGLFIEESNKLLFSYNLGEKWAIAGRDRKTGKGELIDAAVIDSIARLDEPAQIETLLRQIAIPNTMREVQLLSERLQIAENAQDVWKQAIEAKYQFTPGKSLFASSRTSAETQRYARERGYELITIPVENFHAIKFFEQFYPDNVISAEKFHGGQARGKTEKRGNAQFSLETKGEPVDAETRRNLDLLKAHFMTYALTSEQFFRDNGERVALLSRPAVMKSVQFAVAGPEVNFVGDSLFEYDSIANIMYIRGEGTRDFGTTIDLYVQLLKTQTGRGEFETHSQAIVSSMAAAGVAGLRPDFIAEYVPIEGLSDLQRVSPGTYTRQQREQDEKHIAYYQQLAELDKIDITLDEITQRLTALRELRPDGIPKVTQSRPGINTKFYWNGSIYKINPNSLTIEEDTFVHGLEEDWASEVNEKGLDMDFLKFMNLAASTYMQGEKTEEIPRPHRVLSPEEQEVTIAPLVETYIPLALDDGESQTLAFTKGDKEVQLVLKRKGDRIITTRLTDNTQTVLPTGQGAYLFEDSFQDVTVYNNVVEVKPDSECLLQIEKNPDTRTAVVEEVNRGIPKILSNLTVEYGQEVWSDPRRVLLDAMQNHIDASGGLPPEIRFTVMGPNGTMEELTTSELQARDASWQIVGIAIHDDGDGYTTPYLTGLGKTTKGDNELGKYGEGLKMFAASALRQGINLQLGSRDWRVRPIVQPERVKNYETQEMETYNRLAYEVQWLEQSQQGSFTMFSILPPEGGSDVILTGEREATWNAWVEVMDPRQKDEFGRHGLERFVLPPQDNPHTDGVVTVLVDTPGTVYEKRLLVPGESSDSMMFGYNIDETIINTRERNNYSSELLDGYLQRYFLELKDPEVMKKIFTMARDNPETYFYEYNFLPDDESLPKESSTLWRQAFHEVFDNDAILSLQSDLDQRMLKRAINAWRPLRGKEKRIYERLEKAVSNEMHLTNHNLQRLPLSLTRLLAGSVYTSYNFAESLESAEVELPAAEKRKLVTFLKAAHQLVLTQLEALDADPEKRAYLEKIVPLGDLETRKRHIAEMTEDDVVVKAVDFPANGMVETVDGRPKVFLNQKVLTHPLQLLDTDIHELAHYLFGQPDYALGFQRAMMALAVNQPLHTQR